MAVLEPKLSALLNSLDKTEGLVIGLACAVDTVLRPNNDSVILHLFSGGLADSVVSADHPGKNADTVGEYYDALGAGAPDGAGKVLIIERMNVSHSDNICRVGMHNDAVLGVLLEPCHVRHEVSGKLACELTAVGIAPEKLCNVAGLAYADNSEVGCGIVVYVLEVLTGTGNEENLADEIGSLEADRNLTDDLVQIKIIAVSRLSTTSTSRQLILPPFRSSQPRRYMLAVVSHISLMKGASKILPFILYILSFVGRVEPTVNYYSTEVLYYESSKTSMPKMPILSCCRAFF